MTVKDVIKEYNEKGLVQMSNGVKFPDSPRLPTGNFAMDYAMGGGLPMGKVSILWGDESSCKTTLALKAAGNFQKLYPAYKAVLFDLEQSFQPEWAKQLGVDTDELVYVFPAYAEKVVDMLMSFMEAPDCGLIIIDSLGVFAKGNEMESSADKTMVGGSALVISKLFRKLTTKQGLLAIEGRPSPTIIIINQTRIQIGQMFGDPTTMVGGKAPRFASSMTARLWGKNIMDTGVHPTIPAWKEVKGVLTKWRVPILQRNFESNMAAIHTPKIQQGDFGFWALVKSESQRLGLMEKGKKAWSFHGDMYKTQNDILAALAEEGYATAIQQKVSQAAVADLNKHQKT